MASINFDFDSDFPNWDRLRRVFIVTFIYLCGRAWKIGWYGGGLGWDGSPLRLNHTL